MIDIYKHKPHVLLTPKQELYLLGKFIYTIESKDYVLSYHLDSEQILTLFDKARALGLWLYRGSTTETRYPIYFTKKGKTR